MASNASNGGHITENKTENFAVQFKKGLDNYNAILSSDKPTNSPEMQVKFSFSFYLKYLIICVPDGYKNHNEVIRKSYMFGIHSRYIQQE